MSNFQFITFWCESFPGKRRRSLNDAVLNHVKKNWNFVSILLDQYFIIEV